MNQRKFDELVVNAQVRFRERMARWEQKWLGERANYGELGGLLQAGRGVLGGFEDTAEEIETQETDLYGQAQRQPVADSEELRGFPGEYPEEE